MADPLSAMFSALADPTRRAILARLSLGEATVTELAKPFRIGELQAKIAAAAARRESPAESKA